MARISPIYSSEFLLYRACPTPSSPSPPPNTVKFFIGPGMRGFYTQVTGNRAWGQVFIFSSGPTHPPTPRPFSSPYPSALLIPLPLGPIHPPTPRPYSSPYPSALFISLPLPLLKRKPCPPRSVLLPPGVNGFKISRAIFLSPPQCLHSSFFS